MNPEYARIYRSLYERHWWWRAREAWLIGRLHQWVGEGDQVDGKRRRILDVGCGDRLSFGLLSRWGLVHGVEPDLGLLSQESLADPLLHAGPLGADLPFRGPFDLITALDVIEHMKDERPALRQMHELLADGATLILHVPARMSLWTRHDTANHHYRRYAPAELRDRVREAGFDVVELIGCFWFTVPLKWMQARLERAFTGPDASAALPGIPPPLINGLLIRLCRIEQTLYPILKSTFGSSLYLVARKPPTGIRGGGRQPEDLVPPNRPGSLTSKPPGA